MRALDGTEVVARTSPVRQCYNAGMVIILFGVTGSGKTTVGQILAASVGWNFYDADHFHSAANIEKMRQGIPLTDEDRWPWLESLRALIRHCIKEEEDAVLACSALKDAYRRYLKTDDEVKLVYLKAELAVIQQRVRARRAHFIDPGLLQSQFDILEPPSADALVIEVTESPEKIVEQIRKNLEI
jgi:gluconokinase